MGVNIKKSKKLAAAPVAVEATQIEAAPAVEVIAAPVEATAAIEAPAVVEPAPAPEPPVPAYQFFGYPVDGKGKTATPVEITDANRAAILAEIRDLALLATGEKDGLTSSINPKSLHAVVRVYRPVGKFGPVTVMDEKMAACRIAHAELNKLAGKKVVLNGGYGSHTATDERASSLYEAIKAFFSAPAESAAQ